MSDTEAHLAFLKETLTEVKTDVRYLRENFVTKDDCVERHRKIDDDIDERATKVELLSVREDIKDIKKPLWALGSAVILYIVNWIMGRVNL